MTTTAPRPFVFILMPFAKEYDDLYTFGIKAACDSAGAYCERVDEQIFPGSVFGRIVNQISKADLVVALMTGRNPNVFYETGYAHALGKTTILLTNNSNDIPFDLRDKPHIVYEDGIKKLNEKLHAHIKYFLENPEEKTTLPTTRLDLYESGKLLTDGTFFDVIGVNKTLNFHIDIHNPTDQPIPGNKVRISIVCSEMLKEAAKERFSTTLPTGQFIVDLPPVPNLLPQSWTQLRFQLYRPKGDEFKTGDHLGLTFNIYTESGVTTISPVAFVNAQKRKSGPFTVEGVQGDA